MGYSFGAATALRTAIQHPQLVRRLVVVSVPCQRDGWYPGEPGRDGPDGARSPSR